MKIRVFILSLTGLITTAAFGQEPGLPARLGMIGSACTPQGDPIADGSRVEIRNAETDALVASTGIGALLEKMDEGRFASSIPVTDLTAGSYYVRIY